MAIRIELVTLKGSHDFASTAQFLSFHNVVRTWQQRSSTANA